MTGQPILQRLCARKRAYFFTSGVNVQSVDEKNAAGTYRRLVNEVYRVVGDDKNMREMKSLVKSFGSRLELNTLDTVGYDLLQSLIQNYDHPSKENRVTVQTKKEAYIDKVKNCMGANETFSPAILTLNKFLLERNLIQNQDITHVIFPLAEK